LDRRFTLPHFQGHQQARCRVPKVFVASIAGPQLVQVRAGVLQALS